MRLAPRLVLAFGFLAAVSVAGLGLAVRQGEQTKATTDFNARVKRACLELTKEVTRQAERDATLVDNACRPLELADRVAVEIESGRLDEHRTRFSQLVPPRRVAYDLDELVLATSKGDIIGADPRSLLGTSAKDIERQLAKDTQRFELRTEGTRSLVSRCRFRMQGSAGSVGLIGGRNLDPLLARIGSTLDVGVQVGESKTELQNVAHDTCTLRDDFGHSLPITVTKSTEELRANIERIDQLVLVAALISTGIALLFSIVLARSLGRPIAELARQARKVASGDARPLRVQGSGEIRDLVVAFDTMIEDLSKTRQRLADASRVAAWREVARRVAHEVKNPLAPIRAAVETLRRLRAREDPAFDEYFDEATRTVLDEVHRISNIVTEFTRFARLPRPKPQPVDLAELVTSILTLHKADSGVQFEAIAEAPTPTIRADRDQIVQVLTNLVQNATDALKGQKDARVTLRTGMAGPGHVFVSVTDNGAGIDPAIAERLFEPYATTKAHGTGLGLPIAQRIALEHDGELVHLPGSAFGRGATFRLTLPVAGPPEAPPDSSE